MTTPANAVCDKRTGRVPRRHTTKELAFPNAGDTVRCARVPQKRTGRVPRRHTTKELAFPNAGDTVRCARVPPKRTGRVPRRHTTKELAFPNAGDAVRCARVTRKRTGRVPRRHTTKELAFPNAGDAVRCARVTRKRTGRVPRRHTTKELEFPNAGDAVRCARVTRKRTGRVPRRHTTKELTPRTAGTRSVVRVFIRSAKDAAARHQSTKELACPSGGAIDTAAVLRVFLKSDLPGLRGAKRVRNLAPARGRILEWKATGSGSKPFEQWCDKPNQKPGSGSRVQNSGDDGAGRPSIPIGRVLFFFRDSALPSFSFDAVRDSALRSRKLQVYPANFFCLRGCLHALNSRRSCSKTPLKSTSVAKFLGRGERCR